MTDEIDQASERAEFEASVAVAKVCQLAKQFDTGSAGSVAFVGNFSKGLLKSSI